jgi:hypothetical protein
VIDQLHTPPALNTRVKSLWYPLDRRVGAPQSWSRHCGEEKNLALPGMEPGPSSPSLYQLSYPASAPVPLLNDKWISKQAKCTTPEILTVADSEITVFWDVMPYSSFDRHIFPLDI